MLKIRETFPRSDLNFPQVTSSYGGRNLVKMWKNRYKLEKSEQIQLKEIWPIFRCVEICM